MTAERMSLQFYETGAAPAAYNMALDEALLEEAIAGRQRPALRFYSWAPPAITLGYSQNAYDEVDLDACRAAGVSVVRRITGGGAVYHHCELTYSIVVPVSVAPGEIEASYRLICGAIASGLDFLKKGFEFSPVNDIIFRSRKVSGSAQVRRGGWLLQHGTVLLDADLDGMFSLLRVPETKYRKHGLAQARNRVGSLREAIGGDVGFSEAADAVLKGLRGVFDISVVPDAIPTRVVDLAGVVRRKFESDEWNLEKRVTEVS